MAWLAVVGATARLLALFGWANAMGIFQDYTRPANSAVTRRQMSPGYHHSKVLEALAVPMVLYSLI